MPGYNRTGPQGQGSMTGRGFGICRTASGTAPSQNTYGRRFGKSLETRCGNRNRPAGIEPGFGRWCRGNNPSARTLFQEDPADRITVLKAQADSIRQTLDGINSQIKDLEKVSDES